VKYHAAQRILGGDLMPSPMERRKRVKREPNDWTDEQLDVILRAIRKVRADEAAPEMSSGRALELICAEFLSG
jgi:hypothetical protein